MAGKESGGGTGYEDIVDALSARIASGDLAPGEKVPGEKEVMATYKVSRDTAYRALQALRDEGLTVGRQGAPTRVRTFKPIRRQETQRLQAGVWGAGVSMWEIDVRDERPGVADLVVDPIEASAKVAAVLGVTRGQTVIRRSRRYVLDGKPVMLATSYIPADIAAGTRIAEPDTGSGGIYARLKDLGHEPVTFGLELRSRMPNRAERARLELDRGVPVILLLRTAVTEAGRVVGLEDMVLDSSSYILDFVIPA